MGAVGNARPQHGMVIPGIANHNASCWGLLVRFLRFVAVLGPIVASYGVLGAFYLGAAFWLFSILGAPGKWSFWIVSKFTGPPKCLKW